MHTGNLWLKLFSKIWFQISAGNNIQPSKGGMVACNWISVSSLHITFDFPKRAHPKAWSNYLNGWRQTEIDKFLKYFRFPCNCRYESWDNWLQVRRRLTCFYCIPRHVGTKPNFPCIVIMEQKWSSYHCSSSVSIPGNTVISLHCSWINLYLIHSAKSCIFAARKA